MMLVLGVVSFLLSLRTECFLVGSVSLRCMVQNSSVGRMRAGRYSVGQGICASRIAAQRTWLGLWLDDIPPLASVSGAFPLPSRVLISWVQGIVAAFSH